MLMGKGLSGLSLCVRVWEPGAVFVKLAKWNRLETCHVYGWLMRVIGVGDVKFVKNQNASLLSVVGVMNLAGHEVLEMQECFYKTWKDKYKKIEHKECSKSWFVLFSESNVIQVLLLHKFHLFQQMNFAFSTNGFNLRTNIKSHP